MGTIFWCSFCTAKYNQLIFLFSWAGDYLVMMNCEETSFTEQVLVMRWLFCITVSTVKYSLSWERIIPVRKKSTCTLPKACSGIVRFPNPLLQEVNWGARQGLDKSLLRRRKWPVPGWRATIGGKCVIGSRSLLRSAEVTRSVPGWWNRSMGGAPFCSGSFDTLDGGEGAGCV